MQVIGDILYAIGGFRSPNNAEKYNLTTQESTGFTNNLNNEHLQAASCINNQWEILVLSGFKSNKVVEKLKYSGNDWEVFENSGYKDRFGRNIPQGLSYAKFDYQF